MQWILWFQVIERELPYGRGWTGELKFYDVALKLQLNFHCKWYICQHFVCVEQWLLKTDNVDISLRLNKSFAFFLAGKTKKKKGMSDTQTYEPAYLQCFEEFYTYFFHTKSVSWGKKIYNQIFIWSIKTLNLRWTREITWQPYANHC